MVRALWKLGTLARKTSVKPAATTLQQRELTTLPRQLLISLGQGTYRVVAQMRSQVNNHPTAAKIEPLSDDKAVYVGLRLIGPLVFVTWFGVNWVQDESRAKEKETLMQLKRESEVRLKTKMDMLSEQSSWHDMVSEQLSRLEKEIQALEKIKSAKGNDVEGK